MALDRRQDVLAGEKADRLRKSVDHGKFVLRRRQQRIDSLAERGLDADRGEPRLHRLADRKPFQRLLRRAHLRFAGCGDIDEDGDEDEQRIAEEAEEPEADGEGLADPGGDVGRPLGPHPHRQEGVQNAAAIHRKGGDQIEEREKEVGRRKPPGERQADVVDVEVPRVEGAERGDQRKRDDEVDGRPGEGDHELLPRVGRQALEAGDAADRQQRHLLRLNAVAPRRQDVAELVQDDAGEEEDDEERAVDRRAGAAPSPGAEGDPGEEQEEGDMDLDGRAAEPADGEGPGHRSASSFRVQVPPPRRGRHSSSLRI